MEDDEGGKTRTTDASALEPCAQAPGSSLAFVPPRPYTIPFYSYPSSRWVQPTLACVVQCSWIKLLKGDNRKRELRSGLRRSHAFPTPETRPGTTPHTETRRVQFFYATVVFCTEVSHGDYTCPIFRGDGYSLSLGFKDPGE